MGFCSKVSCLQQLLTRSMAAKNLTLRIKPAAMNVLASRLYTTSSYKRFNEPLRFNNVHKVFVSCDSGDRGEVVEEVVAEIKRLEVAMAEDEQIGEPYHLCLSSAQDEVFTCEVRTKRLHDAVEKLEKKPQCDIRTYRHPHPFKTTVYELDEGLRKLRAVGEQFALSATWLIVLTVKADLRLMLCQQRQREMPNNSTRERTYTGE